QVRWHSPLALWLSVLRCVPIPPCSSSSSMEGSSANAITTALSLGRKLTDLVNECYGDLSPSTLQEGILCGAPIQELVKKSMNPAHVALGVSTALFIGILACLEIGYRLGRRNLVKNPEHAHEGIGVIEAAVFALLGLLLGFSFAGGTSRLDAKRQLIVQEANAIGTAYLRVDVVPINDQTELRRLFRDYLDTRILVYQKLPDVKAAEQQLARAAELQMEIWSHAVAASHNDPTHNVARLCLPAINEMIDVTTARTIAMHTQLPRLIFIL